MTGPPPSTWDKHRACTSTGAELYPIDIPSEPHSNPNATVELIGRVNEANIFIGDIHIMALINTGA